MGYVNVDSLQMILWLVAAVFCQQFQGSLCSESAVTGKIGNTVTLACSSVTDKDIFMFWETPLGIVAPGYNVSHSKFKYDILTGALKMFIHHEGEKGKYSCYSRGINNRMIRISTIELKVEERWQMAGSSLVSTLHRLIVLVSVAIVILGLWIAHMMWMKFLRKSYIMEGTAPPNLRHIYRQIDQLESLDEDVELTQLNP
ncbi:IG [Nesidiocoris tenuis]|uniref:IG n=1 Tax=Nesidiocoris tenuis TaxID=355587 RepID=A0ABN7AJA6_9HEMI|nr:IG [Nesidiocoris tenuis]